MENIFFHPPFILFKPRHMPKLRGLPITNDKINEGVKEVQYPRYHKGFPCQPMHASAPSIYTKIIEALKLSHKEYSSIS
jgi:hypothetical protein